MKPRAREHLQRLYRTPRETKTRYGLLRLDKNENCIGWPAAAVQAAHRRLTAEQLVAYPETDRFYRGLAKYLRLPERCLYVGAGSDACIKAVFEAYVRPQDSVVCLHPSYAMYGVYARMYEARWRTVSYDHELGLDAAAVVAAIDRKTRLVCIANPNSPTGTVIARTDIMGIIRAASRQGALVLIDEAYYPYWPQTMLGAIRRHDNVIITRSFTKAWGLGGVRLGYAAAAPAIIEMLQKVRPLYEINTYAIAMGLYALEHPRLLADTLSAFTAGRAYVLDALARRGICFYPPAANFLLIRMGGAAAARRTGIRLAERGILVKTGFSGCRPLAECLRVSIGTVAQMRRFVREFIAAGGDNAQ